jgi:citrate synthase
MPTIVAAYDRLRNGDEPLDADPDRGHAEDFLRMLVGETPSDDAAATMDTALVLHADHGLNASTFTARVISSTLSDMYAAVTGAVGALKGPLHGGANQAVMEMLEEIGEPEQVGDYIAGKLENKEKIMGFGHRVYNTMDPRATILRRYSERLSEEDGETRWFEMSTRIQEIMQSELDIDPNVDFYSASTYRALGIPTDLYTTIFAMSRAAGWTAHVLEQYDGNRLIRPRGKYVGPETADWVDVDRR